MIMKKTHHERETRARSETLAAPNGTVPYIRARRDSVTCCSFPEYAPIIAGTSGSC